MRKVSLVTGCVITAMMASHVLPSQVVAAEEKQAIELSVSKSNADAALTLQELGTQTILLKTQALTLLKQPTVVATTMPDLSTYQDKAKQHASYWLDVVQPSFIDANQQIISFQQKFQSYYDKLIELSSKMDTDPQAKQDFIAGIRKLQESVSNHQYQMQTMSSNLQQFKDKFDVDAQNFINAATNAQKSLADKNGEIAALTKQIQSINADITATTGLIVGGVITMVAGIGGITLGTIALFATTGGTVAVIIPALAGIVTGTGGLLGGGLTVGFAAKKLDNKRKELQETTQKLTSAQTEAASLTLLSEQVNTFKDTVTKGEDSLEGFHDNWYTLQQNFTKLKKNVDQVNPDSSVLQSYLAQIKKSVDDLATQAKQQEQIITGISYQ
ncbi:HBL/NHE enterotoxin family protein [Thermoactinomyces sp. DSM 45892]|uniref:HBL/NHE enterotoxin family protein n=1 Tax=Thermoactinomyces sp. DSM 45892 TaxID=1882753 RepID=UPI000897501E|nr:HBL/NHE enterotoxin family protein [Thermoactinomyces sp. DSM 45892]SDY24323.1 haemolytic enterotoxin (HBL) [Thermoactinomyces sp. DSM 45892]